MKNRKQFAWIALFGSLWVIIRLIYGALTSESSFSTSAMMTVALMLIAFVVVGAWAAERRDKREAMTTRETTNLTASHPPRESDLRPVYPHAQEAAERAAIEAESHMPLMLTDIGFIVHYDGHGAHLHRTNPTLNSADAIQPYVELEIYERRHWTIDFEVIDQYQLPVFQHVVSRYAGGGQRILMTPRAQLDVKRFSPDGTWTLKVRANNRLIAVHHFGWMADNVSSVEGHIESDGEINESLLPLLADDYAQPLSLDDLLGQPKDRQ